MFGATKGMSAYRRYQVRTAAFFIPYLALCIALMTTDLFDGIVGKPAGWVLAAAITVPVIGQLWATLALLRESDEFVRMLTAKRFIVAAGLAMAAAVFWSFGEILAGAPHMSGWMIYPLFWVVFGVTSPFIRTSR